MENLLISPQMRNFSNKAVTFICNGATHLELEQLLF